MAQALPVQIPRHEEVKFPALPELVRIPLPRP